MKKNESMKKKRITFLLLLLSMSLSWLDSSCRQPDKVPSKVSKKRMTVADRVAQYGDAVRMRLAPHFKEVNVSYPPARIKLIGLKQEETLEVWVAEKEGNWKHLKDYPILGMSGTIGPKLRKGDRQAPEGIYKVESLNPNSRYHLALRVNYPNKDDLRQAKEDGRTNLGGDIMIHGDTCSIGCLAMGDQAAEDLFILAAETGYTNVSIILSPVDFRVRDLPKNQPSIADWTDELYTTIRQALQQVK